MVSDSGNEMTSFVRQSDPLFLATINNSNAVPILRFLDIPVIYRTRTEPLLDSSSWTVTRSTDTTPLSQNLRDA